MRRIDSGSSHDGPAECDFLNLVRAVDDRQGSLNARRTGLAMIDQTNREH